MADKEQDKDWKLKLRYGKLVTPYKHFTLIAEGIVGSELKHGFSCPLGPAFMGMKVWASSEDEAAEMIRNIGKQIGFEVTKQIYVYDIEPVEAPQDEPFGYDIGFNPFTDAQ